MTTEKIMSLPNCPKCDADYTYEDGALLVCPMCAHEWTASETAALEDAEADEVIRDAVGNELQDGDAVQVAHPVGHAVHHGGGAAVLAAHALHLQPQPKGLWVGHLVGSDQPRANGAKAVEVLALVPGACALNLGLAL